MKRRVWTDGAAIWLDALLETGQERDKKGCEVDFHVLSSAVREMWDEYYSWVIGIDRGTGTEYRSPRGSRY